MCSIKGNTAVFTWELTSRETCVDIFILEIAIRKIKKEKKEKVFTEVYRDQEKAYSVKNIPYNSEVTGRLKSMNWSGEGKTSKEISLKTEKGKLLL